jgi:hypothetical protein
MGGLISVFVWMNFLHVFLIFIHYLAVKFWKNKIMRSIGIRIDQIPYSQKLSIYSLETGVDIFIASALQYYEIHRQRPEGA